MASNDDGAPDQLQEPIQEELDLTPYEEDDDATLHRKLVAAKMARKRAEEDLKLLCNRIGLLKQEENKVSFCKTDLPGKSNCYTQQQTL